VRGKKPARLAFFAGLEIVRPFTLLAPALGMVSGALTALGAHPRIVHTDASRRAWLVDLAIGTLAAAILNGASNVLNQICDLAIDRINKPHRVLPSGRMSERTALALSVALYAAALGMAAMVNPSVLAMFGCAAFATILYSAPPFRTKRLGWWANVTIAIPRGVLLKVAGWALTRSILSTEAWVIGGIFGLFLLGATTSKDFADVDGDRADGCRTLPIVYGRERATRLIHPFFVVPFLLLAAGAATGVLTGNRTILVALGLGCAAWGHAVVRMLQRDPDVKVTENHPSWRHMYYLMFTVQIGLVVAYLLG
jgi:4-hydroxybenzoate polyprenyltransferase